MVARSFSHRPRRVAALLVLALALALLPACDSDDGGSNSLDAVSGTYGATRLTLVTEGRLVDNVNVLRRAGNVEIRFFPDDGDFNFTYSFENDDGERSVRNFNGGYDVSGGEARLDIDGNEDRRRQLLLPDQFALDIDGNTLAGDIERNDIDLGNFSEDDYDSQSASGTLEFRLEQ